MNTTAKTRPPRDILKLLSTCKLHHALRATLLVSAAACLFSGGLEAAVIRGTVLNQNTQTYLERAIVRVDGTTLQTLTARDGSFRIAGVPAGTHTLIVNYTGLDEASVPVVVGESDPAPIEVKLTSEDIYLLDEMVVTSAAEGTAFAINQQRRAETIRSVTSIDAFLDTVTGSPAEFVKSVAGLQMDYNQNEPQTIRIRGMDPTLTVITMDGNELASPSDSNDTRRTMIDQLSMALIGDVEVFKAPTPDRSANAIGGLVNFNTKSAFDQVGRRASLTLGLTMDSHDFHFRKTPSPGHGDPDMRRALLIGRFEYSNSFFDNRLGVVFSLGRDDTNQVGSSETLPVVVSPLPGGTLPPAGTPYTHDNVTIRRGAYNISPNRQRRTREDISINTDFKITEDLSVFLKTSYTDYISTNRNHSWTLTPGTLSPGATAEIYSSTNGTFAQGVSVFEPKNTRSWQIAPGMKFRSGNWKVDLAGGVSKSINDYINPTTFSGIATRIAEGGTVDFTLNAPIDSERPRAIVINGGLDPYNLANYRFANPAPLTATGPSSLLSNLGGSVTRNDRESSEVRWSGRFDVQRDFQGNHPFYLKGGLAFNLIERERHNTNKTWNWVGPDGVPGGPDDNMNMTIFAEPPGVGKSNFPDFHLREPDYISTRKISEYMEANPQAFWYNEAQAANARLTNRRKIMEEVNAAYLMGSITLDKLNVLAGVRVEATDITATGVRTLPTSGPNDIRLTTPGLNTSMNANSLPVVLAKYRQVRTTSDYTSDPFPYLHLRYEFLPGLQARTSYTEAIGRPSFNQILPSVSQNDTASPPSVSFNPVGLKPQRSKNYDLSIEYYTKTAGEWTAAWFGRDVVDYISSERVQVSVAGPELRDALVELGIDPATVGGYDIVTTTNLGTAKWSGFEISVRQRLRDFSFMPEALHGIEIWANYTKIAQMEGTFTGGATGPVITAIANTVPELYNAGISYRSPRGKFYVQVTTNFQEETPTANVVPTNQLLDQADAYQFWNAEFSYRISSKLRLTGTARNLTSERKSFSQVQGIVRNRQQDTGIGYVFSMKYDL